ncbi:MAG: InlB B-repeat-containing protein [Anaerovoracaceae bacterium]
MSQVIGVNGLNAVKTGRLFMAIILSILLTISCIPSELPSGVFGESENVIEASAGAYTAAGTVITGSRVYTMTGGRTVEAFNTAVAGITEGSLKISESGIISGHIDTAEGYTLSSVTVKLQGADASVDAAVSEDGAGFSFKAPQGNSKLAVTPTAISTKKWDGGVDISWYDPASDKYYIGEPAQLAGLAALINGRLDADTPMSMVKGNTEYIKSVPHDNVMLVGAGGGNVSDKVYTSTIDFAHKTVYLTADLDMGGVKDASGKWSGPNYTPVGGKFSMDIDMVNGDSQVIDTRFNGVFDGQGHIVKNIYCERYSDKGFPYSMAVGLVGFLGGKSDVGGISSDFADGWIPAVRNVVVGEGYIRGRRMVGGVVGRMGDASNGSIIESCANHAEIKNTDAKGVGGILGSTTGGSIKGKGTVRNCYNTGNVSTTYSCPAGGIVGANSGVNISNCYNVGTINSNGAKKGRGIGGHDSGSYKVVNCFSLKGCDDDPESEGYYKGSSRKISVEVTQMDSAQMKSDTMLSALNANGTIFAKSNGTNNGYPVLVYEATGYPSGSYTVTLTQSSGGTIGTDVDKAAAPGQTVNFTANPIQGYKLSHFIVNGKPIEGSFYVATSNLSVSAVFTPVKAVTVNIPNSEEYSIVVTVTGNIKNQDGLKEVKNYPIKSGAVVMENSDLLVRASLYKGAKPSDNTKEYSGIFRYDATNANKVSVGRYIVTGAGNVNITAVPETRAATGMSNADTSWFAAKENSFTVSTPEQLAGLAYLVNDKGLTFSGKTVKLDRDISVAGGADGRIWTAIGTSLNKSFQGTFDGQNHVIGGMRAESNGSYTALFGYCSGAVIKNLTVRGSSVNKSGMSYAAGIVSYAQSCEISNCINRADVKADGEIAGGIAAYITEGTSIKNCRNYGNISGATAVGGITGVCQSASDSIESCVNIGNVTSTGAGLGGTGGIAGKLVGSISDCINAGAISGNDRYTGGISGYTNGRKTSTVTGSQNQGSVTSSSNNENAALGGVVGYGQFGTYTKCSSTGAVTIGGGFQSRGVGAIIGHIGKEPALSQASECKFSSTSYSYGVNRGSYDGVTQDDTVEKLSYTEIPDPGDPADTSSGTAGGVIKPDEICGGVTLESGSYTLMNYAAGEIVILPGANVTLTATGKTLGYLTIIAGDGANLTLQDVEYTGDDILLKYTGSGNLKLAGSNRLIGFSDASGNEVPTVYAQGNLTVSGNGSLYVEAAKGNSSVKLNPGSTLNLNGGLLSVNKKELLGRAGGAIFVNGGTVNVAGGSVEGITSSDNVSIISADTVNVSAGSINLTALRSPKVIDAKSVNISGGTVRASAHTGNSAKVQKSFAGAAAIPNIKGNAAFYSETERFSSVAPSSQKIVVDGKEVAMEIYNIDGSNYFKLRDMAALMAGTKSEFSVNFNADTKSMYSVRGSAYSAVGGEMLTGSDKSSSCTPSSWVLYVNDKLISCKVYNIGGNNFFKLRDMAAAFGITVSYDSATNTANIKS